MASPKGMLALMLPKGGGGGDASSSKGPGASPLNAKAEALKSMWDNMKSGDFKAAALDFHDAYMECQKAEESEGGADYEGGTDAEDDTNES
jgi:hypothetical protein